MAEHPGASIAVIAEYKYGEHCIVAIQRDDIPGLAYAGWWELPGGTLELGETPEEGAVRECLEEVNVVVDPEDIHGNDEHLIEDPVNTVLVVAVVSLEKVLQMRLGDEGQACKLFRLNDFLTDNSVIPEQRMRVQRYLYSITAAALAQYNATTVMASNALDQRRVTVPEQSQGQLQITSAID
ncbi:MAG TPA: NUDIX domain-containing protein [Candidatus Saccharimonadales bacterium]|nr:NUDIX domain-containing protein [Candidatus Saccharimonadales bacterium]